MHATFFVWYYGFLARTWQCQHLRDLVTRCRQDGNHLASSTILCLLYAKAKINKENYYRVMDVEICILEIDFSC